MAHGVYRREISAFMCARVRVPGAAQLINKLNGEDFNEADEQLFEVRTTASSGMFQSLSIETAILMITESTQCPLRRARNRLQPTSTEFNSSFTRHTLVEQGIRPLSSLFFSVLLQISRRRWHRSAWNFVWWYILVPDRSSPFLGAVPAGDPEIRNFGPKFWPFDRRYLENGKSQRYV